MWTFNEEAYEWDGYHHRRGKLVGHTGSVCTVTSIRQPGGTPEFLCAGSLKLDREGQITIMGLYLLGAYEFSAALIGGTGRFERMQGIANFTQLSAAETLMDIELNGSVSQD